ncbi:hypothetical protein BMT54_09120, partial [Pasteurellaceae bacterium 15-036681]
MNKIFRVIWNHSTQTWVAVSELAKGRVKSSSSSNDEQNAQAKYLVNLSVVAPISLMLMGMLYSNSVQSVQAGKGQMSYDNVQGLSISFGNATGNSQAIAIGGDISANGAKASSGGAIAIGACATASGATSVALGWNAEAKSDNSIGLGSASRANHTNSVALGAGSATAEANTVSIGNATQTRKIQYVTNGTVSATSTDAINGSQLYAFTSGYFHVNNGSNAGGDTTTNYGLSSQAAGAQATGSITAGMCATTCSTATNAIAIGNNSSVRNGVNSIAMGNDAFTNGGNSIVIGNNATGYVGSRPSSLRQSDNHIAIGTNASSSGISSIALGQDTWSRAQGGVAIGRNAKSSGSAVALGDGATTYNGTADYVRAVAIGNNATAFAQDSVVIGSNSKNETFVDATAKGNETLNYSFLNDAGTDSPSLVVAAGVANSSFSIGNSTANYQRQIHNVAAGRITSTSTDAVNGSQLYNVIHNLGFNIQENGTPKSRINNNNIVNFTNGTFTTASVSDGANSSAVKFDIVTQDVLSNAQGVASVVGTTAGVVTAASVAKAINDSGFTLQANGASGSLIKPGSTLSINQSNNIVVGKTGDNITIATSMTPTFTAVTATDKITTSGLIVSGTGKTVDMGGNRVQNVATGTAATDAVNLAQLNASKASVIQGSNVNVTSSTSAAGTVYTVNAYNSTVVGSGDVSVCATSKAGNVTEYSVDLSATAKQNITNALMTANTANSTADAANQTANAANATVNKGWNLTTAQTTGGSATGTITDQINMGELVTIEAGKNVNVSQSANKISLSVNDNPTFSTVTTTGAATIGGMLNANGGLTVGATKTVDMGGNRVQNVATGTAATDAVNLAQLNASKASVIQGSNVNVTSSTSAAGTVYTVNAYNSTVVGSGDVSVCATSKAGNVTEYSVDLSATAKQNITNALTTANTANSTADAANQTANAANATVNKGWNITTSNSTGNVDGSTDHNVKMGEEVIIDAGKNINITQSGNNISIATNENSSFTSVTTGMLSTTGIATIAGMLTANGGLTVANGQTVNMGNNQVKNVADGTEDKDAVNLSQLNATKAEVNKGWNITTSNSTGNVDGASVHNVQMGEQVVVDAGKNINITQSGNNISIATNENSSFTSVTTGTLSTTGIATIAGML